MHPREFDASFRSRDFGPGQDQGLMGGRPGGHRKECRAVETCRIPPRCGIRDYTVFRGHGILPE